MLLSMVFVSCEKIHPKAEIPSYIQVNSINLSTNTSSEGSNVNNITDAWIFVDDNLMGIYELPVTFPVNEMGTHEIMVRAGIKKNGMASSRVIYPFYDQYSVTTNLTEKEITVIAPTIEYYSNLQFAWMEDFEVGTSLVKSGSSDTTLEMISSFNGIQLDNKCAAIYLDQSKTYFEISTNASQFNLPIGTPIYMELSYMCASPFSIGVFKNTTFGLEKTSPYITINPSSSWKTIYIDINDAAKSHTNALSFEIYFAGTIGADLTESYILLDYIKLIYN